MQTIVELNETNFDQALAEADGAVVVDFYAPWCGPCKMLAPLLEQLAHHFAGRIEFFKVNVDQASELALRYEITGVPTLLFFRAGAVEGGMVGISSPRDLVAKLEALAATTEVQP